MITRERMVQLVRAAMDASGGLEDAERMVDDALAIPDPELGKVAALGVVYELRTRAEDQPDTRKGARWAVELGRAAATIEQVYELGEQ